MAKTAQRRHNRYVKGMRRIREDRQEHGEDHSCPCFEADGRGYVFSRFADTPASCSCWMCRPRKYDGPTLQERRAPTAAEWD